MGIAATIGRKKQQAEMNESGERLAWLAVPVGRRKAILDRKQRRSKLTKRMLCSLVLLVTMSTMGMLVGCTDASTPYVSGTSQTSTVPITFTELEQVLQGSDWEGSWEGGEYLDGGPAKLFLAILGDDTVRARISIYESGQGDFTFWAMGTLNGNTMELTSRSGKTVLSLSEENGVFVLRGGYKITSGQYVGETGTYYFKKK